MQSKRLYTKDFFGDALKYLPSVIIPSLSGVLLLPVLTRLFPLDAYGYYTLTMSVLAFAQTILNGWLSSVIIRFHPAAEIEGSVSELVSTAFTITLLSSFLGSCLFLFGTLSFSSYLHPIFLTMLVLLPLLMFPSILIMLPMQLSRATRHLFAYNALTAARVLLVPLAGIVFALILNGKVEGMIAGGAVLSWLLVPLAYGSLGPTERPRLHLFNGLLSRKLLSFGLPIIPSYLLVQVLDISDRFIINTYRGSAEAGLYAANYQMAILPMSLITALITGAAGPLIVTVWETHGREKSEAFGNFLTRIYFIVAAPCVFGLIFLARDIMLLLSGDIYAEGSRIFLFVSSGGFLVGLQWIAQRGLLLANRTKEILTYYLIAGTLNIIANVVLVPKVGYIAAAWNTLAAYFVLLIMIAIGSSRFLRLMLPYYSIFRTSLACCVMMLFLCNMPARISDFLLLSIALKVLAGAFIYALAIVLLGEIRFREIAEYWSGKEISSYLNKLE